MCWEFKHAHVYCLPDCSIRKTSEENPTTGMICPEFERTGQHCDNPIKTNLVVVAGYCPEHNRQHAVYLQPDQQRNTQLPVHLQGNVQTVGERWGHGQASTEETIGPFGQHPRMPNHNCDSSRWPWSYLQNQALDSIYQDNNGIPPLGMYEHSSLSPPMPTFGAGSSSKNRKSDMPENNAGQKSYQEQDRPSRRDESISYGPAQGGSNQRNEHRKSAKQRDLTSNWRRDH